MLKFDPNVEPPDILRSSRLHSRRRELLEFLRRAPEEREQRRAPLDESLFHEPELLEALAARWRSRCAFCETDIQSPRRAHHFRPLRDARQPNDSMPEKDYYAWLAYDWDNLLLLCDWCAKSKHSYFPTNGYRAPFLASLSEIRSNEAALLIDPLIEESTRHIRFLLTGFCEGLTVKGNMTVQLLDLNRPGLVRAREDELLQLHREWIALLPQAEKREIAEFVHLSRPHAGARIDLIRRLLRTTPGVGQPARGPTETYPFRLASMINPLWGEERGRLVERMKALLVEDESRSKELADSPRAFIHTGARPDPKSRARRPLASDRQMADIAIRNFKGIERLDLAMASGRKAHSGVPCLMLLGENAVGKSSTLAAIALALIGAREARRLKLKPSEFLRSTATYRWDQLDASLLEVNISFHAADEIASLRLDPRAERIDGTSDPATVVLGYGPHRYFDARRFKRPANAASRVRTLFDPLYVIPYPGTWLKGLPNQQFHAVARALREVFSLRDQDELVRDVDGRIAVYDGARFTPVERLSEGYRSVFAMVVDIIREMMDHWANLEEAQGVVLIDEIETHLHPRWKMNVMSSLRRALPQVQFVVTTHDPLCLRGMDNGEVVVLERDQERRIVKLDDLPSVKGMGAEQLLTSDYFGLSSTIDPETELQFSAYSSAVEASDDPEAASLSVAMERARELVLGDTAAEQIIFEALRRFIKGRRAPGAPRAELRDEAIGAVLEAFKRGPGGGA